MVSVPLVVPITPLIETLPAPPTVSGCVPPLIPPDTVKVPASELIRAPPLPRVIAPLQVLLLARFRRAPPFERPVPTSEFKGSATKSPLPSTWIAAPAATLVVPATVPNPALFRTLAVPALTVVAPV